MKRWTSRLLFATGVKRKKWSSIVVGDPATAVTHN